MFFSDSGSVAVEIALKMAVQYCAIAASGAHDVHRLQGGYHGDTTGAMAVSDPDTGMHDVFRGALPEQVILDLPVGKSGEAALSAYLRLHGEELAGIIVEPLVQGAGGMQFHDAER